MQKYLVGLFALVGAGMASATALDVSSVTTALEAAAEPVGVIGLAMLVAIVGPKVFKLIRRAL